MLGQVLLQLQLNSPPVVGVKVGFVVGVTVGFAVGFGVGTVVGRGVGLGDNEGSGLMSEVGGVSTPTSFSTWVVEIEGLGKRAGLAFSGSEFVSDRVSKLPRTIKPPTINLFFITENYRVHV